LNAFSAERRTSFEVDLFIFMYTNTFPLLAAIDVAHHWNWELKNVIIENALFDCPNTLPNLHSLSLSCVSMSKPKRFAEVRQSVN